MTVPLSSPEHTPMLASSTALSPCGGYHLQQTDGIQNNVFHVFQLTDPARANFACCYLGREMRRMPDDREYDIRNKTHRSKTTAPLLKSVVLYINTICVIFRNYRFTATFSYREAVELDDTESYARQPATQMGCVRHPICRIRNIGKDLKRIRPNEQSKPCPVVAIS